MLKPWAWTNDMINVRVLVGALLTGGAAYAVIQSGVRLPVTGTIFYTDPREVFMTLGASLTGPVGAMIIALFVGTARAATEGIPYRILAYAVAGGGMAFYYRCLLHGRMRMPSMILGWVAGIPLYYAVSFVVGLGVPYLVDRNAYIAMVGEDLPISESIAFLASSIRYEIIFTMVLTSLFWAALPYRFRRPLWGGGVQCVDARTSRLDRVDTGFRAMLAGRFLGIRLTIWFLFLSVIPFFTVILFVRNEAQEAFLTIETMQRREQARVVAGLIGEGDDTDARRVVASIRSAVRGECFVVDSNGRYVAHTESTRVGRNLSVDFEPETIARFSTEGMATYRHVASDRLFGFARTSSGRYLVVAESSPRFATHTITNLTAFMQQRLALSFVFVALSAGIVIWIMVARPVRRLTEAVEAISRDNLSVTVPVDEMDDEVRVLGQAFNAMTEDLRTAYRGLEEEIAERTSANEQVRRSRGQLAEALRIARMGYFEADLRSFTITLSEEALGLYGELEGVRAAQPYPFMELMQRTVHPDDVQRIEQTILEVVDSSLPVPPREMEYRIRQSIGGEAWIYMYYSTTWHDGRPHSILGTMQDITDRKRAELESEASKRKFQAVVENNIDAITLIDERGVIDYASPSVEYILGLTPAEIEGTTLFDHVHMDDVPILRASYDAVLRQPGSSVRRAYRVRHADGSWVWLEAIAKNSLDDPAVHAVVVNYRDITERKLAEEELVQLRQAVEASTEVVFMTDPDGLFRYVNRAFTRLYGYQPEEVLGRVTPRILKSGIMPQGEYDRFWQAIVHAHGVHGELTNRRKDGSLVTVEATANAVLGPHGSILGYLAIQRDITERKQGDEALRHSEQNLRTAQRIGKIGSWEVDLMARTTVWSDETFRIFDRDPATFVPSETSYLDSIHPEDREAIRSALIATATRGISLRAQHRIVLNEKALKYVEVMGEVIHGANGIPLRVVGSIQDITESKLAEEALNDKVRRLQLLRELGFLFASTLNQEEIVDKISTFIPQYLGVTRALIRFTDPEHKELVALPEGGDPLSKEEWKHVARPAGYSISGLCLLENRPVVVNDCRSSDLISPEWIRHFNLRSVLAVPIRTTSTTIGVLRVDDSERYGRFTDADVEFVSLVADQLAVALENARLYTAAKTAEEEKERLNAELERRVKERTAQLESVNKELESFSYSVSHDLRAPLRHISGFVELLRGRVRDTLDAESVRYLATISQSAVRLGNLIDELLSFSRIGRTDLRSASLDLGALLKEVRRDLEPDLKGRAVEWRVGDLPLVVGDATLLKLVLANLLSNAVKFSRNRDVAVIEVGSMPSGQPGGFHTCFVRDNGAGFDQEYASKLFGVFQRLHSSEEFEGTGIGLANVRRIVQRHGGATWAEGALDAGATIYFTLPSAAEA